MSKPQTERFEMRVSGDFLAIIDEWRRNQPNIPTRAEAIRTLVVRGIFESRDVQDEYRRILTELHDAGRLTDDEWALVRGAVTRHVDKLVERTATIKESFDRMMGLSSEDD